MKKRLKLFQIACVLFLLLCLSSCRAEVSSGLDYSRTWTYAQSRTLEFQCVINSAEEIDANVINTVLTQISGSAALEYRKDTCTFAIQEIKVKIGAGEVEFSYDSSQTYTDERRIFRNRIPDQADVLRLFQRRHVKISYGTHNRSDSVPGNCVRL